MVRRSAKNQPNPVATSSTIDVLGAVELALPVLVVAVQPDRVDPGHRDARATGSRCTTGRCRESWSRSQRRRVPVRAIGRARSGPWALITDARIWHSRTVMDNAIDERTVTVGIDGSPGSVVALRWAMDHADGLGRVIPVAAFVAGPLEHEFGTHTRSEATAEYYRDRMVTLVSEFLAQHAPEVVDDGVIIEQVAGPGLVDASTGSELLVVGTRGGAPRDGLSIGSVGAYCARHATVPVALIPLDLPPSHDRLSVVVGVDGSPQSAQALRWTLDHVRRDAIVTAVWVTTAGPIVGEPLAMSTDDVEAAAARRLEDLVVDVVTEADGHPEVDLLVVHGDPREQLGSAVDDADLIVVGTRGHGVVHRLVLGSVAMALVHHPTMPTIVVPPDGT